MISISPKADLNYLAKVVAIPKVISPIPKADNLVSIKIDGNNVLVSKSVQSGELGIFFPVECQIAPEFLHANNLYAHPENNIDPTKKGYFVDARRVKALKLRGEPSEGFWADQKMFEKYLDFLKIERLDLSKFLNKEFDMVGDHKLVQKYRIPLTRKQIREEAARPKTWRQKFWAWWYKPKPQIHPTKLVPGQFRFHYNTSQLGKNTHEFDYNSTILITKKLHGTSFIAANLLHQKKPSFRDKVAKLLGVPVQTQDYEKFFATRTTIRYPEFQKEDDVYFQVFQEVQEFLTPGISIYGEIVGYRSSGSWIQKGYDYGCEFGKHDFYVYRITYTSPDGEVWEADYHRMKAWCEARNLKMVPMVWYGLAREKLATTHPFETLDDWQSRLLTELRAKHLEKPCTICKTQVYDEGIVVRKESHEPMAYKLKSFAFLKHESLALDAGEVGAEDQEEEA